MYRLDSNCTRQLVKLVRNFGFKFILIVGMSVWESRFCSIITVHMYKLQLEFECSNTYGSLYRASSNIGHTISGSYLELRGPA